MNDAGGWLHRRLFAFGFPPPASKRGMTMCSVPTVAGASFIFTLIGQQSAGVLEAMYICALLLGLCRRHRDLLQNRDIVSSFVFRVCFLSSQIRKCIVPPNLIASHTFSAIFLILFAFTHLFIDCINRGVQISPNLGATSKFWSPAW